MICKVCNCNFDTLDTNRLVCFNCSKIDYEKMYRMAQREIEQLKATLTESTEMLEKATNCFKVFGMMSPHYYPYTKQIEKNREILG